MKREPYSTGETTSDPTPDAESPAAHEPIANGADWEVNYKSGGWPGGGRALLRLKLAEMREAVRASIASAVLGVELAIALAPRRCGERRVGERAPAHPSARASCPAV